MTNNTIEAVTDVIEETVDAIERIPTAHLNGTTKKQQIIILGVTALGAGLVGGALGHFITKKMLTTKFEATLKEEVEAAREFYALTNKKSADGTPLSPQEVFSQYASEDVKKTTSEYDTRSNNIVVEAPGATEQELTDGHQGNVIPGVVYTQDGDESEPATPEELMNIFEGHEPTEDELVWDDQVERAKRSSDRPYIISHDEFYQAEQDYDQDELIYYDVDGVLADSQGIPVPDPEATVGEAHLEMFGYGSKDANVLFIRNDRLQLDIEVTKANGRYSVMVLGLDGDDAEETELRHSYRSPRKFRASDE